MSEDSSDGELQQYGDGGPERSRERVSASDKMGEDQFRLLAQNIPTLCWMANPDGYIYWYNNRWHDYCGSTPKQMEGWGWRSVHDPHTLPKVMEAWTGSIATAQPFEMTFPLRRADGIFRPFLTRAQPLFGIDGKVERWFGVNIDVAAQFEAEDALRAANVKLHAVAAEREATLAQLGEGVIVTDAEGRITFVNDAATRLHGVALLDVAPEDYSRTYSLFTEAGEPHPVESLPLTRAVRDLETVIDARWRIRRPDGSEVLAIGNARPVYDEAGAPIGAVLTIRDDTNRYAAEEALGEAVKIKDILLHEVNHRVKNSLQLVTSLLMLQAGKTDSPELKKSLLEARARIGVVAGMHQRLYTTGQHDRVDLSSYLRELAIETVGALDGEGRIELRFAGSTEVDMPLDQAVPLALIVSELLTNAVKYAFRDHQRGTIDVAIRSSENDIQISLRDNGCGLPDGFDPAQSTTLGMRIVTALTRQVRGTLDLPQEETGAEFLITLPRHA